MNAALHLAAKPLNVLVVAAHPDDAEIGMGGTIARLAHQGHRVLICDLTDGSPTPRGDRASRMIEAAAALDALQPPPAEASSGAPVGAVGPSQPIARVMLDLPNRTLMHSIEARHALAGVIRAHQARVVFVPHWEDAHPDHIAATRIAEDARFDAKLTKVQMPTPPAFAGFEPSRGLGPPIYPTWLFYYDISHLRRVMTPSFCMDITGYERAKQRSVKAYRSQFGPWDDGAVDSSSFSQGDPKRGRGEPLSGHEPPAGGPAADPGRLIASDFPERLLAYAAFYGSRIGVKYAEAFVTREPMGLSGLSELTGM